MAVGDKAFRDLEMIQKDFVTAEFVVETKSVAGVTDVVGPAFGSTKPPILDSVSSDGAKPSR